LAGVESGFRPARQLDVALCGCIVAGMGLHRQQRVDPCGRHHLARADTAAVQHQLADAGEVERAGIQAAEGARLAEHRAVDAPAGVHAGAHRRPQVLRDLLRQPPAGRALDRHAQQLGVAAAVAIALVGWLGDLQAGHRAAQVLRQIEDRHVRPRRAVLFLERDAAAHRQQVAQPHLGETRILALELGQVARDRIVDATDVAVADRLAQQQGHHRLGHRERGQQRVALAAGEVLLMHDAPVAQHDQRDRALLLQPGAQLAAIGRGGQRQCLGCGRQRHRLARGRYRCVVEVLMVGDHRALLADDPSRRQQRAAAGQGQRQQQRAQRAGRKRAERSG